jgi:SAM-dependent methyltransferase
MHDARDDTTPSCPICGGRAADFIAIGDRPLIICRDCRHICWRDMPTDEDLGAYYSGAYARDHNQEAIQSSARDYYRQHAGDLARKWGGRGRLTLLDYGCAWPTFLEEARSVPAYERLVGVDYDAAARAQGAALGLDMQTPGEVVAALGEWSVDILRFSHVVEHMRDPVATLADLARLLRPGGLVYITQPLFPALKPDARPSGIKDAVYPEHLHFFTAASLARAVAGTGAELFEMAAFQKEEDVAAEFGDGVDRAHAAGVNEALRDLTPAGFHRLGGYPDFIGENVYLYARKPREPQATRRMSLPGEAGTTRSLRSRLSGLFARKR